MDILVDPYYMFGTRDEMFALSLVNLWYYGHLDSCERPANRRNARSMSRNIQFTFIADKGTLCFSYLSRGATLAYCPSDFWFRCMVRNEE